MSDKNLYINDLIHRYASHTFTESTINDIMTVTFKDSGSVTVAEAEGMTFLDAYRKIREDLLGEEYPAFLTTTTERDALTGHVAGTQIYNMTTGTDEVYDGTNWFNAAGELGPLTHLAASTVTTTDNTQTVLATVTLDAGSVYLFTAEVIGETTDHATVLGEILEVTVKRLSTGDAIIVGSATTTHTGKDSGASSWAVTFTVSGNDLRISVTGANSTTVNWEADLNYLKF